MEWVWVMIPVTALMIPIVAVLTHHQQKMAQILNRPTDAGELAALRNDIAELKTLAHSQAIALDNLAASQRALGAAPVPPKLSDRLSSGNQV